MSGHGRSVDLTSPHYREGCRMANLLLDVGDGPAAPEWVQVGVVAQNVAHGREDVDWYHRARGFTDTMREYLEAAGS